MDQHKDQRDKDGERTDAETGKPLQLDEKQQKDDKNRQGQPGQQQQGQPQHQPGQHQPGTERKPDMEKQGGERR